MNHYVFIVLAGLGAALAIGVLAVAGDSFATPLIMAPFGATAVLVFGVPKSPLAQPKNVIFGHLITAFIGISFVQFVGVTPYTMAIATGLAVSAMLLTDTTHPPAGANPLLIMLTHQSWGFLLTPVLSGAIIIVLVGTGMNKLQAMKKQNAA